MKISKLKFGTGAVIFILFFGVSVLEAFRTGNWIAAVGWLVIAFVFLLLDNVPGKETH